MDRAKRDEARTPFRVLSPIHQANRQARLFIDELLKDLGVTADDGQLLAFIASRDGVPVTAVVRLLGVAKSTMTSILRRLEDASLLRRDSNPHDGRSDLLFVTRKGRLVAMKAREKVLEFEQELQSKMTNSDLRALDRIVNVITRETGINLPKEFPRRRNP
jgi:DNA-binding MarR family transcriptional regulator